MKKRIFTFELMMMLIFAMNCFADVPTDMAFVEGGYAVMGAEYGDLNADENAKPIHLVFLDGFYMDKYEVSNQDYAKCVAAGDCKAPRNNDSKTREEYYTNPDFARFPVVNVTWQDAADYCEYMGKRLPTEAEWERGARGGEDGRTYPWGFGLPREYNVNVTKVPGDTELPNSYARGISIYGIADTIGNVSEWTADWYSDTAYEESEIEFPKGPETGTEKTVRGDSFETPLSSMNVMNRYSKDPNAYSYDLGFRCVKDCLEVIQYETEETSEPEYDFGYIKAGNENGIFLYDQPGSAYTGTLQGIIPNGAVVQILGGPVEINYSSWYRVAATDGRQGWTLSSAIRFFEVEEKGESREP